MIRADAPDAAATAGEDELARSLDLARQHSALAWELRTATSLASRLQAQGRHAEARMLLAPIHDRFTEGFATANLQAARRMVDELG